MNEDPMPKMPASSPSEQLQWDAFCYLTGEMDLSQVGQFEDRLETDQAAREAVAAALETLQLVTAAESLAPAVEPRRRKVWRVGLAWMSLGAAVALLLAVALPRLWTGSTNNDWQAAGLTPELAIAWSKSANAATDVGTLTVPADETHDNEDAADESNSDIRHAAPAWMMAAVRGLAQPKSPDSLPASPDSPALPEEMEN